MAAVMSDGCVPEEIVLQVWEASGENLEEAAAGLWFMKVRRCRSSIYVYSASTPLPPSYVTLKHRR